MLNVGLMLVFAPLFAKTWRIYRIFGRKKLSVVQISNRKLMLLVAALLSIEVVLMAVWQAVGPITALTTDITTTTTNAAGKLVINEYVQCGVPGGRSMSMFAVICVEKGALFVFGALMAFTTRKVSSTFNESQGISLSIYNVCFTIGIISPIVVVVSAVGDVLTLLLVFALLWIAYFTCGILFVPKLMTIYQQGGVSGTGQYTVDNASTTSSSGYQFLSLAALSTLPMLQSYQLALRNHLERVDARVARMKQERQGGGGGSVTGHGKAPSAGSLVKPSTVTMGRLKTEPSMMSINGTESAVGKSAVYALFSPSDAAGALGRAERRSVEVIDDSVESKKEEATATTSSEQDDEQAKAVATVDATNPRSRSLPVSTKLSARLIARPSGSTLR